MTEKSQSANMNEADRQQDKTEREKAATWLFNQVVPTILLFLMMVGGWYTANFQIPEMVKGALAELKDIHITASNTAKVAYEADQERDEQRYRRLEQIVDDVFRGRRPLLGQKKPGPNDPL